MKLPFKNVTIFAGYLGKNAELRHLPNGDAVASLRLVYRHSVRENNDWKTYDEWATVVLYRQLAEDFAKAGHVAGAFIHVQGRRHTRQWTDGQNRQKTAHEIIADEWHAVLLPAKTDRVSTAANDPADAQAPARPTQKRKNEATTESLA